MRRLLTPGYAVRPAQSHEAEVVYGIIVSSDIAEFGASHGYTLDDLRDDWRGLDCERNAWVVVSPDGGLVGYAFIQNRSQGLFDVEVYVHPDHVGHGIGTALVRLTEARAREHIPLAPSGIQAVIHNHVNARNPEACQLLEREGYAPLRSSRRMEQTFGQQPALPAQPIGVMIRRSATSEDLRTLHAVLEEAMADHWGYVPLSFEEWQRRRRRSGWAPGLSFLAFAGREPAGAVLCRYAERMGWVDLLAVRRPWRGRGIGRALLFHAFSEFFRRGTPHVGLVVDAANPTGANHLYQSAGMIATQQYVTYSKAVRPGSDSSGKGET